MSELPELIQALLEPSAYPHHPRSVELVQTQMSFIFLADDYVYKVKKPVDLGYLDYTTLEKRRFYCQREVELNQRLCSDAYLGVVSVVNEKGHISLEGQGEALEYAVKMRRLPQQAMMNVLLAQDRVSPQMLTRVAEKLAEFHRSAQTGPAISAFGDLGTITGNTEENFSQTEKYIGRTISQERYQHIRDYTNSFIAQNTDLFRRRVAEGRIRDCHGDLHAAHICFCDDICIYDCIEFNDRFRYGDVASEVAFLAMDLDHYGRADLSRHFVKSYVARSQDEELMRLLNFYKCYRAYVRGKVESLKLDDPYITPEEKRRTEDIAASYFDLAHAYTWSRPVLFITVGLVGTGKTTLSQALAKRLGLVVISSDVTRKRLAGIPLTEHRLEEFDRGIYSAEFTRRTYDKLFEEAKDTLGQGGSVILDASFIKRAERLRAKSLAEEMNADFIILECVLDEENVKRYLAQRWQQGSVSDGRWEIYQSQRGHFDPVTEVADAAHIIVDTSLPEDEVIRHTLDEITRRKAES
ncbi:MAG TPA: AAA family ATPase [Dehalococcoidia bacterium]|jgi:hypothetical protein|nr:AAA family ATPase [Dehalococcoidia bacterium]